MSSSRMGLAGGVHVQVLGAACQLVGRRHVRAVGGEGRRPFLVRNLLARESRASHVGHLVPAGIGGSPRPADPGRSAPSPFCENQVRQRGPGDGRRTSGRSASPSSGPRTMGRSIPMASQKARMSSAQSSYDHASGVVRGRSAMVAQVQVDDLRDVGQAREVRLEVRVVVLARPAMDEQRPSGARAWSHRPGRAPRPRHRTTIACR